MKWFKDRFAEPSSWIALAGLLQFAGMMTQSSELPVIAEALNGNASLLAQGDYVGASINIASVLALGLGFGKREKAR